MGKGEGRICSHVSMHEAKQGPTTGPKREKNKGIDRRTERARRSGIKTSAHLAPGVVYLLFQVVDGRLVADIGGDDEQIGLANDGCNLSSCFLQTFLIDICDSNLHSESAECD